MYRVHLFLNDLLSSQQPLGLHPFSQPVARLLAFLYLVEPLQNSPQSLPGGKCFVERL